MSTGRAIRRVFEAARQAGERQRQRESQSEQATQSLQDEPQPAPAARSTAATPSDPPAQDAAAEKL